MRLLAALAFVTCAALAARADDAPKDAAKKLEGVYEMVAAVRGGQPEKDKDGVKEVVIKDGEILIRTDKRDEVAKFSLDPSKKPAHIDLAPPNGAVLGIYETKETDKGLELTIAFVKGKDTERPKDFKGESRDEMVIKLLRKKTK